MSNILRDVVLRLVRAKSVDDLTLRQLVVLLQAYTESNGQTVRGLAAQMNISKPAVTRSLDRLEALGLIVRKRDPEDGRSILVGKTDKGGDYKGYVDALMKHAVEANKRGGNRLAPEPMMPPSLSRLDARINNAALARVAKKGQSVVRIAKPSSMKKPLPAIQPQK